MKRGVTFYANVVRAQLIGGAASIAKAVNDSKAVQRQLELQSHDRAIEQDCISLRTNADSDCISAPTTRTEQQRKKNAKETIKKCSRVQLSTFQLNETYARTIL